VNFNAVTESSINIFKDASPVCDFIDDGVTSHSVSVGGILLVSIRDAAKEVINLGAQNMGQSLSKKSPEREHDSKPNCL
jgi:hypothetical protein